MDTDWKPLALDSADELSRLATAVDDGVVREVRIIGGSFVDHEYRLHYARDTAVMLFIQTQWKETPAVAVAFTGVSSMAYDPEKDMAVTATRAGEAHEVRLLSVRVVARAASVKYLEEFLLGEEATLPE